jgi:dolichyl-phosphate-mannose-protein mannosyltransferase
MSKQALNRDRSSVSLLPTAPIYPWFAIGIAVLLVLSLAFRFWGLERFNTLVFDEIYYAKFAQNYLSQTPFFDGHPPLSKYLIALSMALGKVFPFPQEPVNAMLGVPYASWNYRWLNALLGSVIPIVILGLTYSLTQRRTTALIAGGLAFLDGMLLVESRYALNNIHLLLFGLLGLWALLLSLDRGVLGRLLWLGLSGVCFGLATSIKWNGLWFLLAAYGVWSIGCVVQRVAPTILQPPVADSERATSRGVPPPNQSAIAKLAQFNPWQIATFLGILPTLSTLTYIVVWIPHLKLNAKQGFWQDFWNLQVEILDYHQRVGNSVEIHRYCSNWYSWFAMWRPVAYFYKITDRTAPTPGDYAVPPVTTDQVIYDVHSIGNPFLWWFSTIAIAVAIAVLVWIAVQYASHHLAARSGSLTARSFRLPLSSLDRGVILFVVVGYLANLLPWTRVTRCTFLYHYMGASVFALIMLAWLCDRWLRSEQVYLRRFAIGVLTIITIAFLFWLPLYLGLPLSPDEFKLRMWLQSWI